ncbi:methyl-accepting chemotaxis protein [Alteriqipengyuania lutimaris]|uniref:Chemotaxis protein n=1 Tax=Alteriqipengyuania lutimaris TaxID=1538146 RepID=A0A395LPJ1_9SPHN|nr:methyl-accepting chemotaxis protein [Alteriqipengyuania lutimaris]MBB3032509.1 methyl-accepting chemotaxis protein [Alteriqipengyuania lutimaris]RDS78357.1 chemotaxis protein [Alteriqipengyuania lutimaris]
MHWFRAVAPIRLKLLVAFGSLTALCASVGIVGLIMGDVITMIAGAVAVVISAILGTLYRSNIADPYVATVVRMEGLAAGDLDSPIEFVDYQDCVGRITRAMFTFRDAAVDQKRQADEQAEVVRVLAAHLAKLSEGDLTAEVNAEFPPAYAELKTNFNEAVVRLREMISAVADSAEAIGTGSREIAQASEDLARRTEGNAASLEETSASLAQIDERLRASAKSGQTTVERADSAISVVSGGRAIADEAVQAMGRVSESAKGIDAVIEGLDKIAFQTRVLAMNAAVEAGRAGEAGRGFAVVADLVSALAMRAEEEAQLARDQLTVTQTDIGTAVGAVQRVDGALAEITEGVGEVHNLLGTMAADNHTQSASVTEISSAISSMDQSTQQNAAMVEQTSAAARNLLNEVASLSERAALFHTGRPGAASNKVTVSAPATKARSLPAPARQDAKEYVSPVSALPANAASHSRTDDWNDF